MNDGAAICFPCGRFSRPVKPYSKPIRYADRLLVLSHDSSERSKKPSPSVSPLTMGVGNNEHPFTMVRGAKGGCGEHFPFSIVPERGQVPHDDLNSAGEQAPDVFDDCVFWPDLVDKPCVFIPQSTPLPFLDSRTLASQTYILTGKAAAQNVYARGL